MKTTGATVRDCNFTGVHWDAEAIEAVSMVALGLLNLSELFLAQNIKIESLLKIDHQPPDVPPVKIKKRRK